MPGDRSALLQVRVSGLLVGAPTDTIEYVTPQDSRQRLKPRIPASRRTIYRTPCPRIFQIGYPSLSISVLQTEFGDPSLLVTCASRCNRTLTKKQAKPCSVENRGYHVNYGSHYRGETFAVKQYIHRSRHVPRWAPPCHRSEHVPLPCIFTFQTLPPCSPHHLPE